MAMTRTDPLVFFEAPRAFVEPALRVLRMGNTALDSLFYDVNVFWTELFWRGTAVVTSDAGASHSTQAFAMLNLGALTNPEGSILVVDAGRAPYVRRFDDVPGFLQYANGEGAELRTISVTGVGSSALGSASFAWNLSVALAEPVAAIVPGYGVADVVQQALGGWFGFGLTNWIKKATQEALADVAPETSKIGRGLMMTAPGHVSAETTGAPVFRRGSGSSDVLHAVLVESRFIERVFGHSKGALVIDNAIRDLPAPTSDRLKIVTFGCPVAKDVDDADYRQFLGLLDGLGLLNSWGNHPDSRPLAHHSTNTAIPFCMPVSLLARLAEADISAWRPVAPALLAGPERIAAPVGEKEAELQPHAR
ncbi:hypothetical protein [Methylosinus sp. Ce-a6]|uniref:hypothetical protein n=1 Tax=Methylosinus sp. Ce-a6 TaxID=2172005 RepID=UPI00135B9E64|nr:hypothetical protein [Methylosinus sp. Ce-a6]